MISRIKSFFSNTLTEEQKILLKLRQLNDFEAFVNYFKSQKIDPNFQDSNGLSLLMICVNPNLSDSYKYAEFLLNSGCDVNKRDKSGRTAFLMVCHWEEKELVELFLTKRPNLDLGTFAEKENVFPTNPVVSCLWKENYELAELLFRKGACPFKAEQLLTKYTNIPEKTSKIVKNQQQWKSAREPVILAKEAQKVYIKNCCERKKPIKKSVLLVRLPPAYFKFMMDFIL